MTTTNTPCEVCWPPILTGDLRFCSSHHLYHRGTADLPSVTSVIKAVWPSSLTGVDEAVIENARERGAEVDEIFCAWLGSVFENDEIPAGYREDSVALALKLIDWWMKQPFTTFSRDRLQARFDAETQVRLDDGSVAGTADVIVGDTLIDIKATYSKERTWEPQLGAYAALAGQRIKKCGILHVTARFREARYYEYDLADVLDQWNTTRKFWELTRR